MDLKKHIGEIEKHEKISYYRYQSSRVFFIGMTLIFFLNYLFVGKSFFLSFFLLLLPLTYLGFIVSMLLFFYFFLIQKKEFDVSKKNIIKGILGIFGIIFYLPFFLQFFS